MKNGSALALLIAAFALAGCTQSQNEQTQKAVGQGADQAWAKTKEGAQQAWQSTQKVAQSVGKTVSKDAQQVEETAKVKGPIDASKDIDSSQVSVETIGKTIYINGTVPTETQKEKLLQIAHANADSGYKIESNLKAKAPSIDDSGQ